MILFLIYVLLSSSGLILFKMGSKDVGLELSKTLFSVTLSWQMLLGILCYLLSFILWLVIVSKSNLSYVYPMSIAMINIALLVGAYYFLNEPITVRTVVGVSIIIIGVVVLK